MDYARVTEMSRKLTQDGSVLDYGPDRSRLLLRVLRTLATGRPVSGEQVEQISTELGIARDEAREFLRTVTERDAADRIVGLLGLSLNDHPHRFTVNDQRLSTWCAEDTLFLPALLGQTATVESSSPLTRETVRLRVSPQGVEDVRPPGAVVSIAIVDPDRTDMRSVEAIWRTFCRHVHFFASRDEAEQWAAGRGDIAILSVDEGYKMGRQLWARFLAYAA